MHDIYTIIAEPSRRRILDCLLRSDATVKDLTEELGLSQPLISSHLRLLRESGLVRVQADAQRRIYSLDASPLAGVDDWLSTYRAKWNQHVDKLEEHLDRQKRIKKENLQ
ncbi:winged helix-turn-helix transcriptional regulator [Paenibacillus sp. CGMCC 1.16610]|uniref:Metalloregulator ArsR/SmtB family transcription factor n=1 Tax=Paenibacillus anseongense TaxID=2682845 RepID=A0ABW9UMZ1_9BACL|nr:MULTISPECIES: metalloregulator ArsR/SmtB family transcription factor [Paenibacillus]MBA2941076.1 winged helix-turn-helix transcriptional regulator [Paenibacillus sp. CGMCC 1.16610]MVQ39895.1 metalloregulator ArsR/SmtB family transcription factor [Paenibacillus anseongense]